LRRPMADASMSSSEESYDGLTKQEDDLLHLIQGIFSLFSVLGCAFMLLVVFTLKNPKKTKTTFTVGLAFTKLIPSLAIFFTDMVLFNSSDRDHNKLCEVEAVIIQLFLPVSWLYTVCISFLMWMRIQGVPEERFPSIAKILHIICWIVPVTITLAIVVEERHGHYDWCWLSNKVDARHVDILLYFFVPMAVLYILNVGIVSYAYYKARQDFWNTSELAGLITRGMKLKIKRQMEKLVSYPIVFLCCYTFAVVNRFYNYKHPGHPIFVLAILHSTMLLDGFVTSLVFGLTRAVKRRISKRVQTLYTLVRRKKEPVGRGIV